MATESLTRTEPEHGGLGSLVNPSRLSEWSWVLFYTAALTSASAFRFQSWLAEGWDLGFYQQGLWVIFHHGLWAESTLGGKPVIADTASFILWILSPLYQVGQTGFLLALQSFALGLGFWWLLRIGEDLGVPPRTARMVGVIYLLYPALIAANLYDFHPDALAVPLLLAAVHFSLKRRWLAYAGAILFALAVKDMVAIAVAGIGVSLLCGPERRERLAGAATLIGAAAWLTGTTAYLIPLLSHAPMMQWASYYGQYGHTPAAGARDLVQHPQLFFTWVRSERAWEYLIWILGPLFVVLTAVRRWSWDGWRWIVSALFILEANLLSRFASQTSPFDQYSLFAIPGLFVTALALLRRIERNPGGRLQKVAGAVSVAFLLVMVYHLHETTWHARPAHITALQAAAAAIPGRAPVVAQNFVLPHVANRTILEDTNMLGTIPLKAGTYVVLDPQFTTGNTPTTLVTEWDRFLARSQRTVYAQDGISVYEIVRPVPAGVRP